MNLSPRSIARIRALARPVLVLAPGLEESVVPLDDSKALTLGSDPACGLVLGAAAQRSALVQRGLEGWEILDLSGRGELLVDGEARGAAGLVNGASVTLAGREIAFVDPTADVLPAGLQLLGLPAPGTEATAAAPVAHGDFHDALVAGLKRAPWLLLSLLLHAALFVALLLASAPEVEPPPPPTLEVEFDAATAAVVEEAWDEEEITEEPEVEDEAAEVEAPELREPTAAASAAERPDPGETDEEALQGLGDLGALSGNLGGGASGGGLGALDGGGAEGEVRKTVGRLRASGLDIVFLLDATGSMDGEIAAAKRRIVDLIALVEALGIDFRIGIVAFRDKDDDYVTLEGELTSLRYKAVDFLDRVRAAGGGDNPEAVFDAVREGARMRWSRRAKKVMVLVGDAPPKPKTVDRTIEEIERFHRRGGLFHTMFSDRGADALDPTRRLFARMAEAGGGSAMDLRRDDQLIEAVAMLALETEDRGLVRRLIGGLDSGVRGEIVRTMLRRGDPESVKRQLLRPVVRPQMTLELVRCNAEGRDDPYLGVYIEVLRGDEAAPSTRWLCTVLLRRAVARISGKVDLPRDLLLAVRTFDPEAPRHVQRSTLESIARGLYDRGVLLADDGSR